MPCMDGMGLTPKFIVVKICLQKISKNDNLKPQSPQQKTEEVQEV